MAKQSEATLLLRIKSAGESVLAKTKSALGDIRTWAAAAFAALTTGKAVTAFKEAEEATNKLNQTLINNGIYTKALSQSYQQMAADLQSVTTFEDDAIKTAQAQLQAYLGQTEISRELMMATLDLAAAKKMSLASAADLVGKSIGSSTNALSRYGVEIDTAAPKSEKMAELTRRLNGLFGGQAEASAQGLGALTQMKNAVGDLLEVVGEKLAPFVIASAKAIKNLAEEIGNSQEFIFWLEMALQIIAKIAAGVKFNFLVLKDVIVATFSALYGAITNIASGDFRAAMTAVADSFSQLPDRITERMTGLVSDLNAIDDIYVQQKQAKYDEDVRNRKKSEEAKTRIAEDALKERDDLEKKYEEEGKRRAGVAYEFIRALGVKRVDSFMGMLDDMAAMQQSKSKLLVGIGKAAAIANIAINTANAAMGAHAALNSVPVVGPGLAIAAASSVVAYGAERAATVAGIQLAEGGIVRATPGGVHAIIGEGGRDEAVIPLDDRGGPLMGTTVNLTVYGGVFGDNHQRREFAKALDEELFRLRQSNESLAFDRGVV